VIEMLVSTSLVGKEVRINRGGPDSKVGTLLEVKSDYLALLTKEDGIVYYQLQHIKSITTFSDGGKTSHECSADAKLIKVDSFHKLLEKTELKSVQINRGGPEKVEGIVCKVTDKTIILIHNKEIIRVSIFHIKNISIGKKKDEGKGDGKSGDKNKKEDKSGDKSSDCSQKKQWAFCSTSKKWVWV
jgi:spore coat protein B